MIDYKYFHNYDKKWHWWFWYWQTTSNNQGQCDPTILAESHDQGQRAKEREHHAQVLWMAKARIEREAMTPWDCSAQPGHHSLGPWERAHP